MLGGFCLSDIEEINNGQYIYDFNCNIVKEKCSDIDKLSQRLLTIAGFNSLFIKFSLELSPIDEGMGDIRIIIALKIISAICFGVSVLFCFQGIRVTNTGSIPTGNILVSHLWNDRDKFLVTRIDQMDKEIQEMDSAITDKQYFISQAIIRTIIGLAFLGVSSIVRLYFNIQ